MKAVFWTFQHILLLVAGFWVAWSALAQTNFAYPMAYQWLDIRGHIDRFGPQNHFRHGYHTLSDDAHIDHFAAIVDAIHDRGRGLESLAYSTPDGATSTLLRAPEVLHLQDVSRLVSGWMLTGSMAMAGWLAGLVIIRLRHWSPPSPRRLAVGGLCGVLLITAAVVATGPVKVFYAAHHAIFPPGHPWFFYYQESLMTTLMKAPDLFGFIAALWVMLAVAIIGVGIALQGRMARGS